MTAPDLDALIERLQGFNPPDRTIASQRDYSQAIHDAAAALVQLRDEALVSSNGAAYRAMVGRAKRAEARLAWRDEAQITHYPDCWQDHYGCAKDAVSLLRRAQAIINRWQELYGEFQPEFLPPAHQIEWAEDASEFIDAAREKP